MQIVVTFDPACGVDPRKAAFWCAALDAQVIEFCSRHRLKYVPVVYYSWDVLEKLADAELTRFTNDSYLLTVQTTMIPGALGFHSDIAGIIFARVLWQGDATTISMSHEILELLLDPTCDDYAPLGDGRLQAKEACDRVEGDTYVETGAIDQDSMPVEVSNYLLPSAFEQNSAGPWDRMNKLRAWSAMTPGGYMIVRDEAGDDSNVFARVVPGPEAIGTITMKRRRPDSRLSRRLAARAVAA